METERFAFSTRPPAAWRTIYKAVRLRQGGRYSSLYTSKYVLVLCLGTIFARAHSILVCDDRASPVGITDLSRQILVWWLYLKYIYLCCLRSVCEITNTTVSSTHVLFQPLLRVLIEPHLCNQTPQANAPPHPRPHFFLRWR